MEKEKEKALVVEAQSLVEQLESMLVTDAASMLAQADERKEAMAQGGFILMSRDHSVDSYFEGYEQALKDMERLLEEREANERS